MDSFLIEDPFFDVNFTVYDAYHRYTYPLQLEANPTVQEIVMHIVEEYNKNSIDIMMEVNGQTIMFPIPAQHIIFLLRDALKEMEITDLRADIDGKWLLALLEAHIIKLSVETYTKNFTYVHDTSLLMEDSIARYIHDRVFYDREAWFDKLIDHDYIPPLHMISDTHTIHVFSKTHPVICHKRINTDDDLYRCRLMEPMDVYAKLLNILNNYLIDEHDSVIIVENEDDYALIASMTKNCCNGFIETIYHESRSFIESCKRYCVHLVKDEYISDIVHVHDTQNGLIDDMSPCTNHPPETPDDMPTSILPFIYAFGKDALNGGCL